MKIDGPLGCTPARLNASLLQASESHVHVAEFAPSVLTAPSQREEVQVTGPVRIALLSFLFNWPSTGGGIVHTVELARFLAEAGYDVRHVYARHEPWGIGRVEASLPHPAEALEFDEAAWTLPAIRAAFRRAVDAFDPDCVIITDSWNSKPILADAVRGYPTILRFQAAEGLCPLNNVRLQPDGDGGFRQCPTHQLADPGACAACLDRWGNHSGALHQAERALCGVGTPEYDRLLRQALRESEAVLVVNPLAEAMLGPHAENVRVVTAGMAPARFPWPDPDDPAERPAGTPLRLLFAGLVDEPMKGFAVLHRACERLWQGRQDFELVATADPAGPVDAFTRYVGWQSQDDLPREIRAADVLVMPTIAQEALGRTAVEAMAAGRPVVASRLGGLPFTVLDGATGLLCEPGDPEALARTLATLLDDPDLRTRMGRAGRQRFEAHYAWPGIIERHYRPLLRPRDRAAGRATATAFTPAFPMRVDHDRLVADAAGFFDLAEGDVRAMFRTYRAYSEAQGYAATLGELKTLCFEEAFLLAVLASLARPRAIVEVGTQHGRSARRILDLAAWLGQRPRVVCLDTEDRVEHFRPGEEAELVVGDVTGRFRADVLEAYAPELVFLDVHAHALLREAVAETLAWPGTWLAIHDCGRGLCNPRMALAPDDPAVGSGTGVWERHILAAAFGLDDPLDPRLDDLETATHRLRIFATPHGLALLRPRAAAPGAPELPAPVP